MRAEVFNSLHGSLGYLDCPDCKNRGFIYESKPSGGVYYERAVACQCMERRKSLKNIAESGLYALVRDCNFESFVAREPWQLHARARAVDYLDEYENSWFCALGSVGAGKTHLCIAICGELLSRGLGVHYMLWLRDSPPLKGVPESMAARERTLRRLATVDVLYIDDLFKNEGRARPTPADIRLAHEIINARYIARKTTLISSEWGMNELLAFDEAVGSRIYERSRGFALTFTGDKNQRLV